MNFKVGDRVRTTDKCLSVNTPEYHGVEGTIVEIRTQSSLSIMFRADEPQPADPGDWALYEREIELLQDEIDWKEKYEELKAKLDTFKDAFKALGD